MSNESAFDRVSIDDLQYRIEQGIVFEFSSSQDVANTPARADWLFRTGAKRVVVYDRVVTSNGDALTYQVFKAPTLSDDGTPKEVTNRLGSSGYATTCRVFEAPAVTDDGQPLQPVYMPGAQGAGNRTVGQFNREGLVRVLEPFTDYLCTTLNEGNANPATVEWYVLWAELENPA